MELQSLFLTIGVVVVLCMHLFASEVYDFIIVKMTAKWYKYVILRLGQNKQVLDIGIGTASALLQNKESITEKELTFVGVDYDEQYITSAQQSITKAGLRDRVSVHCKSIFDPNLDKVLGEELYDAAYFSGSWTLMPNPVQALRIAATFVKDEGEIYVTQTFQRSPTPFLSVIKPLLKYITTIDFGPLHYESDLEQYIDQAKEMVDGLSLKVVENCVVPGSIDNKFQSARLIVFKKVKTK